MFRKTHTALENIFFQFNSPLGKGMEELFQNAINFVNGIDYTGVSEDNWVKHRYTETHSYAKRVLFPELQKLIKKVVNMEVTKVVDVKLFSGFFAVDISLDSFTDVNEIFSRQTGTSTGGTTLSSGAKEVSELHKHLDERTSRLDPSKFGANLTRPIKCKLFMDVDMAFLMNDNMPVDAVEPLTAGELTAIYLHEIGHVITLIAQSGNTCQLFAQQKKHLEKIRGASDVNDFVTVYKRDIRPQLKEKVDKKIIGDKLLTVGDAIVEAADYFKYTDTDDYFSGTFEFVFSVLKSVCFGFMLIIVRLYIYLIFYPFIGGLIWLFGDKPGDKGKTTEQSVSNSVYYHAERMADEYAARQGYGGQQASALVKLTTAMRYMPNTLSGNRVESGSLRNSLVYTQYLKFVTGLFEFLRIDFYNISADFGPVSNYEDNVARLHRLLTDTAAVFKSNLTPEIRTYYLDEFKRIEDSLKAMKKPFMLRLSDCVWKYIFDWPTMVKRITQTDDMAELEGYLTKLDTVINNELYVRSAEFKQLAGR